MKKEKLTKKEIELLRIVSKEANEQFDLTTELKPEMLICTTALKDDYKNMTTESILRKLAAGCSKHPAYRYKRTPLKCQECYKLFNYQQKLIKMDAAAAEQLVADKVANKAWDDWRDSLCEKAAND